MDTCPFCAVSPDRVTLASEQALAFADGYPVAERHTLVVPRHHVTHIFDLGAAVQAAQWRLVSQAREQLQDEFHPNAFAIGVNSGTAAGQTVPYAHVHVIPRWRGDVADPCGGVRWVIAGKTARFAIKIRQT